MTKEDRIKLSLSNFVTNISEAISARTHLMRESAVRWVFAPLLCVTVLACLLLFVLDALGRISPMRDSLLSVIKIVLGAGVLGAGFGWLFERKS